MTASQSQPSWPLLAQLSFAELAVMDLELRATILGTDPPVWRTLLFPETWGLVELHSAFQETFSWWDCHLFCFDVESTMFIVDPEDFGWAGDAAVLIGDENPQLRELVSPGASFLYLYDFGDNWIVRVDVVGRRKGVSPPRPHVIDGARTAPPEDVGGTTGFARFLGIMSGPDTEEHREFVEWLGEFDPDAFAPPAATSTGDEDQED